MPVPRPDVSLVTSGHDVADARLHRIVAALDRAGLRVEVHGLGDRSVGPAEASSVIAGPRGSQAARGLRALAWPLRATGRVLLTCDPDTAPAALAWRRLAADRRWVADVHEDYAALLRDRAWVPARALPTAVATTRRLISTCGKADLTVVADDHVPPFAPGCRERLVVRNLPDLGHLPASAPPEGPLRAAYVGDLRTSRGLRDMVEAVAAAPGWHLDLVGPMSAADQAWLHKRTAAAAVAERVTWHGRQPPRAAWAIAARAHVGLSLLHDTPAFRDAMPSKVYEYLACGMAVVATPLPRVVDLLAETGAGLVVEGPQAAASALADLSADPDRLADLRRHASAWGDRLREQASDYDILAGRIARLAGR